MGLFKRKSKTRTRRSSDDAVLDLRSDPVIDLTGAEVPKAEWGFPTRCPECGHHGYLDRIDVIHEIMFQHCPSCWAKWETPRSDTVGA